ncbi:hypothetical protein [Ferrimonas sp. SCSIO 43195]|uniref:hypothetical protein n=1 Tax=Ferrimonas sp. SCSIO 43195 TaxID=2822844 RepID=UPI002075028C|nr:hypothetical protein [Ferrimonas sp. SCSIO 43195]USD37964.1 hypothetical protein J8Z22_01985 [Ferrimonas sp. SCSIO 43195]
MNQFSSGIAGWQHRFRIIKPSGAGLILLLLMVPLLLLMLPLVLLSSLAFWAMNTAWRYRRPGRTQSARDTDVDHASGVIIEGEVINSRQD